MYVVCCDIVQVLHLVFHELLHEFSIRGRAIATVVCGYALHKHLRLVCRYNVASSLPYSPLPPPSSFLQSSPTHTCSHSRPLPPSTSPPPLTHTHTHLLFEAQLSLPLSEGEDGVGTGCPQPLQQLWLSPTQLTAQQHSVELLLQPGGGTCSVRGTCIGIELP